MNKKQKCPQYDNCKKNKEFDCFVKLCDEQQERENRALDALIALTLRQRPEEIPDMKDVDDILSEEDKKAIKDIGNNIFKHIKDYEEEKSKPKSNEKLKEKNYGRR